MGKKSIWLLALAFVVLLGGAALLYDRLSGEYAPEQLAVEQTPVPAATPDPSAPAPTGTPAPRPGRARSRTKPTTGARRTLRPMTPTATPCSSAITSASRWC